MLSNKTIEFIKLDFWFLSEILDAVEKGDLFKTWRLLEIDAASVNGRFNDDTNDTLLLRAATNGHDKIVDLLLVNHADVNGKNKDLFTALMVASFNECHKIVIELINHHADVNAQDKSRTTALMFATLNGRHKHVKALLNHDADVNAQNNDGTTALMFATLNGHHKIATELLNHHADVNARNKDGNTALLFATVNGYHKIVIELLNYHADVNAQNNDKTSALMFATLNGHHEIVIELINHHVDVNAKDKDGTTALMFATLYEHNEIVTELLNNHADPNIQANDGLTALMIAGRHGHNQVVIELCNHNADVNLQHSDGNTVLHSVLLRNVTDSTINIVKLFLSDTKNLEKEKKKNKSVIQLAKESQNADIIKLIEDFSEQKKIEAAKKELKKLQANQIINKRKKKLQEMSILKDEVLDLNQKIYQVMTRNTELEEELKKNCEKIKVWQCTLKNKMENEDLSTYGKLKEDIEYFERCIKTENFDDVVQLAKRECPICFNEMRPNKKIYQCQSGHIFCEECFGRIKEGTKICSFCRVDITSNPIRCRALEEVIEEEANK